MNEKMLPRLTDPRPFLSRYFLTMADNSPKTTLFWPARATTSSGVQKDASASKYAQLSRVLLTFSRGAFDSSDSLLTVKEGVVVQELVVEGGVGVLRDRNDERFVRKSHSQQSSKGGTHCQMHLSLAARSHAPFGVDAHRPCRSDRAGRVVANHRGLVVLGDVLSDLVLKLDHDGWRCESSGACRADEAGGGDVAVLQRRERHVS